MSAPWTSQMLAELLSTPGVVEHCRLRGDIGLMALHGGLESDTYEVARDIAAMSGSSLYAVVQPHDVRWHVPSISYRPGQSAGLESYLDHVAAVVSVHGFSRAGFEGTVLLGGTNRDLATVLAAALSEGTSLRPVLDLEEIPEPLRGTHPDNPVNLPRHGGVQLELSPEARHPDVLSDAVATVAAVLRSRYSVGQT